MTHMILRNRNISFMDEKIKKQDKYLSSKSIYSKKTKQKFIMSFTEEDFNRKLKNDNIYYKLSAEYLNTDMIKKGYLPIFVTNTLPSEYHPYTTYKKEATKKKPYLTKYIPKTNKKGLFTPNPKYKAKNTINAGYQLLKDAHRRIYKNFKVAGKHIRVKFNVVYEPHKDFTPHSHALYYILPQHEELFKEHIKAQSKELGTQQDIKTLRAENKSISYLLKYVSKTLNDNQKAICGWKLKNKIRMFTMSKVENNIPRYVYDRFTKNVPKFYEENGSKHENIFETIRKYVSFCVHTYEEDNTNEVKKEAKAKKKLHIKEEAKKAKKDPNYKKKPYEIVEKKKVKYIRASEEARYSISVFRTKEKKDNLNFVSKEEKQELLKKYKNIYTDLKEDIREISKNIRVLKIDIKEISKKIEDFSEDATVDSYYIKEESLKYFYECFTEVAYMMKEALYDIRETKKLLNKKEEDFTVNYKIDEYKIFKINSKSTDIKLNLNETDILFDFEEIYKKSDFYLI